jgi:hypothetical protein
MPALHTRKVLGRSRLGLSAQIFHLRANIKEHQTTRPELWSGDCITHG